MTVLALQRRLKSLGFDLPKFGADGDFGAETQAAIHKALDELEKLRPGVPAAPAPTGGPVWLDRARTHIGQREIKGPKHNSRIVGWWEAIKAPFRDDETAWCGAFVGGVLAECGMPVAKNGASARAWLNYGVKLDKPAVGAIVVFWRGSKTGWSGHVGFVAGVDRAGNLMVLGGNQGDAVNIKPFDKARVLGYRWPGIAPLDSRYNLPVLTSDGRLSTNEA